MTPTCSKCRSTRIILSKDGTVARCLACLYSWKAVSR